MRNRILKLKTLGILFLIALASAVLLLLLGPNGAFAAADTASPVKKLVNVGENASTGAVWVEAGLPETWVGAMDFIEDDSQPDGGDVILRNELKKSQTSFKKGEAAWARTSMHPELGAYAVNGLEMQFYLSANYGAGEQLKIVFCEKSGWYLNSPNAFQLKIAKQSATKATVYLTYKVNSDGELYTDYFALTDVPMYFDYDYFADKAGGFKAPTGTKNVIRFAADAGVLKLYINDLEFADLSKLQELVLTNISDGVYFNIWSQASSGSLAMRITDIAEKEPVFEDAGVPVGYSLLGEENSISHSLDKMGNSVLKNKEAADWSFYVKRNAPVTANSLDLRFRLQSQTGTALKFDVELYDGESEYFVYSFAFTGANAAQLTVRSGRGDGGKALGSGRVTLYRDGRVNRISLFHAVKYFTEINGDNVTLGFDDANDALAAFSENRAFVQFNLTADGEAMLYGITAGKAEKSEARMLSGYLLDNMLILTGENPIGKAAAADKGFRARYIATQVSGSDFSVELSLGDYAEGGVFRAVLAEKSDAFYAGDCAAVVIEWERKGAQTTVRLYSNDGNGEALVSSASATFDWDFDKTHTLAFARERDGYAVYFDGAKTAEANGAEAEKIQSALAVFDGITGQLQFLCEGEGLLFYPRSVRSFSVASEANGWREGGIGGIMEIAQASSDVRVRFDGGSAVYDCPVPLDGFTLPLKAWHNFDKVETYLALGASGNWYRNEAGVVFSIAYVSDSVARIRVYITDRVNAQVSEKQVGSAEVAFQWNNGFRNYLGLRYDSLSDEWSAYCNGEAVRGDGLSEAIAGIGGLFKANEAYLQLWGNADTVMEFSDLPRLSANRAPVVTGVLQEALEDTASKTIVHLSKLFSDADGDELFFYLKSGEGYIEGNEWFGNAGEGAVVVAEDGRGGACEFKFETQADQASGCGSNAVRLSGFAFALLGLCAVVLVRRAKRN